MSGSRRSWGALALIGAAGFLVGVILVVALGIAHDDAKTTTETVVRVHDHTVTRTVPATITSGGTVVVTVPMPDVTGQSYDVALDTLHAEGLRVRETDDSAFGVLIPQDFTVSSQDPAAGTQVRQGSTVRLELSSD